MILISVAIHTAHEGEEGLTIPAGAVMEVDPHFNTRRVSSVEGDPPDAVEYDIAFDVAIFKSMASFEAGETIVTNAPIKEFNIGFVAKDVDIRSFTSIDDLQNILLQHVLNGDGQYAGVGAGNASIVYPYEP